MFFSFNISWIVFYYAEHTQKYNMYCLFNKSRIYFLINNKFQLIIVSESVQSKQAACNHVFFFFYFVNLFQHYKFSIPNLAHIGYIIDFLCHIFKCSRYFCLPLYIVFFIRHQFKINGLCFIEHVKVYISFKNFLRNISLVI